MVLEATSCVDCNSASITGLYCSMGTAPAVTDDDGWRGVVPGDAPLSEGFSAVWVWRV